VFVDAGPAIRHLLGEVASAGVEVAYVAQLLAAIEGQETSLTGMGADYPQLAEPLSGRELEVLRLIAAGLSNNDIAGELFLALGTVKKHINNIYGKLGAHRRTQAVSRARELGLV